ncbi:Activin receptor type-2A [Eumeta japonica]|uniref:receptor protein serine/threonine kinase n=1 Tax=Eumeta variegata TaxID=151549 RepID=A0A4C1TJU0_EUMVA|nr:Activin receptor type-2A [Eumeta japonica]
MKAAGWLTFCRILNADILIIPDSRAAIRSLIRKNTTSNLVRKCREYLNEMTGHAHVTLKWGRGHESNRCNNIADELARKGSTLPNGDITAFCRLPLQHVVEQNIPFKTSTDSGHWSPHVLWPHLDLGSILNLPRLNFRMAVSVVIGHCTCGNHARRLALNCNDFCRSCVNEKEGYCVASPVPKEKTPENADLIYIIICSIILAILITITGIGLFLYRRRKQAHFNEIPTNEAEITNASPLLSNRPIQLLELKASGRLGDVWQAKLHNQDVAVKIFRMQEKESWNTELEIYKLPRMRHPNILEFLGHEKHTEKIQQEFWLISAYQHNGSLCDYLKSHTITYKELCKIAESMACGLAHLHEEIFQAKRRTQAFYSTSRF